MNSVTSARGDLQFLCKELIVYYIFVVIVRHFVIRVYSTLVFILFAIKFVFIQFIASPFCNDLPVHVACKKACHRAKRSSARV